MKTWQTEDGSGPMTNEGHCWRYEARTLFDSDSYRDPYGMIPCLCGGVRIVKIHRPVQQCHAKLKALQMKYKEIVDRARRSGAGD